MGEHGTLSGQDTNFDYFIFRSTKGPYERLELKSQYIDLACKKCGKIDEVQALERGIELLKIKSKRDFFHSLDLLPIISEKAKTFFESKYPNEVSFFDLAKNPAFFVALPKRILYPVEGDPAFKVSRRCEACNRFVDAIWGPGILKLSADFTMGLYKLENKTIGMMPGWVVSQDIAHELKKAKLRGLIVSIFPGA